MSSNEIATSVLDALQEAHELMDRADTAIEHACELALPLVVCPDLDHREVGLVNGLRHVMAAIVAWEADMKEGFFEECQEGGDDE